MKSHKLSTTVIATTVASLAIFGAFTSTFAQPKERTFPETGKVVSGRFLEYWTNNGGLAQQGYPISDEFQEKSELDGKTYTVQYFERAEFEMHPENKAPYDVLLSQLGTFQYGEKYPNGAPNQKASTNNPRLFPETNKTVGGRFRTYWEQNGGLAQQGYPISDEFQEKSELDGKTYTVQYFERSVFEMHPENKAPYDVLLSQLGTFRFNEKYPQGEPLPAAGVVPTPVAGCTSNLTPGKWTGPLREQVNFKGEGITGSAVISANMALNVECNGAFTGTETTTGFTAQGNKGLLRVLTCSAPKLPVATFTGKQVVRPDGLHLLIDGGKFTSGTILCKSPLLADKTEDLTGRVINPTDIKVESFSQGKITGSEWLADPLTELVLAEIHASLPNAQIQTTNTGHWELTYQGK